MPMLPVPVPILTRFDAILEKRAVSPINDIARYAFPAALPERPDAIDPLNPVNPVR
ncbi:MAG: hypothetical protein KKF00_12610 [Proteobacteria bacterium]|nr:hypothetical protein [Pseudomonadota bacterium]